MRNYYAPDTSRPPSPAPMPRVTAPSIPKPSMGIGIKGLKGLSSMSAVSAPKQVSTSSSAMAKNAELSATGAAAIGLILAAAVTVLNRRRDEVQAGFLLKEQQPLYNVNPNPKPNYPSFY